MKRILYIGNKLSKHGFTPTNIETLGPSLEKEGFSVLYASNKKNHVIRIVDMITSLLINKNQIDYVLIDTYSTISFWYTFIVSQLSRIFKLKYICILHGGNLPYRLKQNPKICNIIFNNSLTNVSPSGYLFHEFKNNGYKNITYIANSINRDIYSFKSNRNLTVPHLLWVRSFASIYNVNMAIDVFKLIKEKYPEAELCMVGPEKDGSLEKCKNYAKKLNLEVKFTGRLTKKQWITLSESYNIFINTTNTDNTPVSVIEAMCLGLPVVSTNVGGIPYLVEDKKNALLVNPNDSKAMSDAIIQLIENTELYNSITNNAYQLVQTFDWEIVKTKWNDLLK